jgi:hypothetical protein
LRIGDFGFNAGGGERGAGSDESASSERWAGGIPPLKGARGMFLKKIKVRLEKGIRYKIMIINDNNI